jgi:hypothetical protein
MDNQQEPLPPGFSRWPPSNPKAFLDDIEKEWEKEKGRHGKHCALHVVGTNPLSGYMIVMKPTGP